LLLGTFPLPLLSQVPDWSMSVADIIYKNCSGCHHEGGIAPFPLMSYEDASLYAFSIQLDVNAHKMPPWPPDPSYNHLLNEKVLTPGEINTINDWMNGGMPLGDPAFAPPPPVFTGNSMMTDIDTSIQFPAYAVQEEEDEYRTFVIHSGFNKTKYLNEVEFIPENPSIVHHVFLFQDTSNVSWQMDLDDPQPGFAGGGLGGFSPGASLICGWIPGSEILKLPQNMAFKVLHGDLIKPSFGYRVDHAGKSVVMSGDTKFDENLIKHSMNVDLLLHEVCMLPAALNGVPAFQNIMNHHTSPEECGTVFTRTKAKVAAYTHIVQPGSKENPPFRGPSLIVSSSPTVLWLSRPPSWTSNRSVT